MQLFYVIFFSDHKSDIVLHRSTIKELADRISSYFPLDECRKITYTDHLLTLYFTGNQEVVIPGTFRQADLKLSKKLTFKVRVNRDDPYMLDFRITDGYVRLETSRLLRVFTPFAIDVEGNGLFYKMNEKEKHSTIGLIHEHYYPGYEMVAVPDSLGIAYNVLGTDQPEPVDLYFRTNELHYFGITIKLLAKHIIQCNDYEPEVKPVGWAWFRDMIHKVSNNPKVILDEGVIRRVKVTYNLEREQLWFWQEFDIGRPDEH